MKRINVFVACAPQRCHTHTPNYDITAWEIAAAVAFVK